MNIPDWNAITPRTMRSNDEEELQFIMKQNQGGVWDTWARAELQRRQNEKLAELLSHLENAIWRVQQEVISMTQSSVALLGSTQVLVKETAHVHQEVALLTSSSNKLENLTTTLKNLTWVLIILTALAATVPIGIEVWKAFHGHERDSVSTRSEASR